jgi:hypothetical protein
MGLTPKFAKPVGSPDVNTSPAKLPMALLDPLQLTPPNNCPMGLGA